MEANADRWRKTMRAQGRLPWPIPEMDWEGRARFLQLLGQVEQHAFAVRYRGISKCRICGKDNGSKGLCVAEWEWPEGFRHYIEEHGVRPTKDFESFILSRTTSS